MCFRVVRWGILREIDPNIFRQLGQKFDHLHTDVHEINHMGMMNADLQCTMDFGL